MAEGIEKVKIAWHPAFCSAAEFDLRYEKENLIFDPEHNLSKEPLRMDLLIIKKKKDVVIKNDIGRLFRQYNVIEFKSPDDGLTIDDFYKTMGLASIYKGTAPTVNEIPSGELTVSVFRDTRPKKLMQDLIEEGSEIIQTAPGVYEVKDAKFFPAQIVVTSELNAETHAGLKVLSKNAKAEEIDIFLEQAAKADTSQGTMLNINAILQVSVPSNRQVYENIKRRDPKMYSALRDLMKDEIDEAARLGEARGEARAAKKYEAQLVALQEELAKLKLMMA